MERQGEEGRGPRCPTRRIRRNHNDAYHNLCHHDPDEHAHDQRYQTLEEYKLTASRAVEMADSETRLEKWTRILGAVVAPTTILTAVLFYFGYVSSRAEYEYFGLDVDTFGLSTQEYIMRSGQTLFVPLLGTILLAAALLMLHVWLTNRIAPTIDADPPGSPSKATPQRVRLLARGARVVGVALVGAGIILLLAYAYLRYWTLYNLVTPLLLACGAALFAYAAYILNRLQPSESDAPTQSAALPRPVLGLLIGSVIASIFWATATVAQGVGRWKAMEIAQSFDTLPSVILDTKEPLFLRDPGLEGEPTELVPSPAGSAPMPGSAGQTFHYRYHHLRLLIEGKDRMFLVPDKWSASDSTLIVPLDGSVRVQFQFQNHPPR
jgi:hypothetical protein